MRPRLKIRAPRGRNFNQSERAASIWNELKKQVSLVLNGNAESGTSFEELYRMAYTLTVMGEHEFVMRSLIDVIRQHMRIAVQDLNGRIDEEHLTFYTRFCENYTINSEMLVDIFMYHDRVSATFNDPSILTTDTILRAARDEHFYPQVQQQVRFMTWKMHMISPQLDVLQHDLVRQAAMSHGIPISLCSFSGPHPVYLATYPLNQSTVFTRTWTASCHWGLVVAQADGSQWLHEITKTGSHELVGIPEPKPFKEEKARELNLTARVPVGYTFLSPYTIHHRYAKVLRRAYKTLSDNCQTFCNRLLECIRIPLHPQDVFQGLDWAPGTLSQAIIYRRCKDFEKLAVLRQLGLVGPTACLPIGIRTVFLDSVLILIEVGMYLRSVTLAVLMLGVIFTYAQHGNVPLVNQLARLAIRPKADVLRLIYSELYPQERPPREEERQELPRATEIFDVE